ncbi:MAG: hypothetical protein KJ900_06140 [Proteobacteria bacterium]|nr:hypothetical protein [Pseudomonadota bacterium]MCG2744855.1 hypothetical protein [Desulfobacteraceae bacterium]MBU4028983.1 hypothetical protein [Pseudomonadota bacterium]MBU4042461.1 hypothetical protein [Pseudomonadota bacterium]MBU4085353.1 hypothetical protein [Pseudomonadota bacterium]
MAKIAASDRTFAERWCGIIAKRRKPILFLFIAIICFSGLQEIKPAGHATG